MALTINTKIINDADNYSLDAKQVKGSYVAVGTIAERDGLPAATTMAGSLCYVEATDKFYKYNGSAWEEERFANSWGNIIGTLSNQTDLQNALNDKADKFIVNCTFDSLEEQYVFDKNFNEITAALISRKYCVVYDSIDGETGVVNQYEVGYADASSIVFYRIKDGFVISSISLSSSNVVSKQLLSPVPESRKVNNKTLNSDITLSANDVGAYAKPAEGIPKTDLTSSVQTSLDKADTAIQEHQLLKTINSKSILGSGNVETFFNFIQAVASSKWRITHNLNRYPNVSVTDSGGNVVVGDVRYIDMNSLEVEFSAAFSGNAYLN